MLSLVQPASRARALRTTHSAALVGMVGLSFFPGHPRPRLAPFPHVTFDAWAGTSIAVGGVVPGHRRPDLPLRVRWLPVLGRLPRGLSHRALPACRTHAQRGQGHDRRRPLFPDEREARARRRRWARSRWPASVRPLGFLGCYLGSILSKEESRAERHYEELYVRAEPGLGAEVATDPPSANGARSNEKTERVPASTSG